MKENTLDSLVLRRRAMVVTVWIVMVVMLAVGMVVKQQHQIGQLKLCSFEAGMRWEDCQKTKV